MDPSETCWNGSRWNGSNGSCQGGPDVHTRISPYPPWVVIFLWLLTALFSVETILGNLLVLLAYKLERNIRRQLSNKFIVSLAITDLIIGMEGFPLLTVYVVGRERWPLGYLLCQLWLFLDYTLCLVSILNVLLITVDRYGSVCYPAKYRVWQSRSRVRTFIFISWIVPCLLFGMMIFAWEPMTGQGMDDSGKCYAPFLNDPYVNMAMYIIYYWTTLVAMSVLYRGIHTAAKALEDKSKARERQTIALLLGQRCMAQVGVGMILHSSASDEEENMESFFHGQPTVDAGYVTGDCMTQDMVRDTSFLPTTATMTMGDLSNQGGYEELKDEAIVTSDSDEKTTAMTPTAGEKTGLMEGKMIYRDFEEGEDEDVTFPLVPLVEKLENLPSNSSCNPPSSSSVGFFIGSPSRSKTMKRSTSLRRVLAPMNSYGGVAGLAAKANRTKLIGSWSFDEEKIGLKANGKKSAVLELRKPPTPKRKPSSHSGNGFRHDSTCSLDFYDSSKGSAGSLYGDTSLHSVFDMGAADDESKLSIPPSIDASISGESPDRQRPNGHVAIPESSTISSLFSKRTQSGSISSSRSQVSPIIGDQLSLGVSVVPSISSPAKLIDSEENRVTIIPPHSVSQYPLSTRASVQIKISPESELLTPIIEEEKSTATAIVSRPNSVAPSPRVDPQRRISSGSYGTRGRQGTKKYRPDQIVHLTVPGSSTGSNAPGNRKGSSKKSKAFGKRSGKNADTRKRESWQSTSSSLCIDGPKGNNRRFGGSSHNIDEDEDSGASNANRDETRPGSAADDYPVAAGKGPHWLVNLFNNPASILNRKRKVTKAERRARKAFRTITVIVGTFALFWSPYYIVATIYGFCPDCVPAPLFLTSYYLCYLNSSVNPFAYAFANRLFRKTFIRILRGDLRRT